MLWKAQNWRGQFDPWVAQEESMGLTPWTTDPDNAFAAFDALNNGHSIQPQPDGSVILEVHSGGIDHPGTSPTSGGDRSGLTITSAQAATSSGPAGSELVGIHGRELWYRLEHSFPSGLNVLPLKYHNNVGEWHGKAAGGSVLKLGFNGAGDRYGVLYAPFIAGQWGANDWLVQVPIALDVRHVWDIGVGWADDNTGWIHVHLDNQLVATRDNVQTMKTFSSGATEPVAFGCQLYRQKVDASGQPFAPSQLRVHRFGIADSLDAVEAA